MNTILKKALLLAILIIVFAFIFFKNDFFSSIVPGWNTTIYPFWQIILAIMIFAFTVIIFISILISIFKLIFSKNKTKTL